MTRRIAFSNCYFCVGVVWLIGMMIGVAFACSNNSFIAPNEFGDIFMSTSFLKIVLSSLLPLMAAICVWWLGVDFLVYVILFMDGLLYGFSSMFLSNAFGHPIFLTHLHFMFSQSCCSTLLVIMCTRLMSGLRQRNLFKTFLIISVLICIFDYYVIL